MCMKWISLSWFLTMEVQGSTPDTLSDDDIIGGGRNLSIFLWGLIFTLLSIVATWCYFNGEDAAKPSANEEQDKETEVAMRIVQQLVSEDCEKPKVVVSEPPTKAPVRTKSNTLAAKAENIAIEDGEASILCSKYDWEVVDGEDSESKDRHRRRSMEEMSLIFPGFLPKIAEEAEEEESESSGGSEEANDDAITQISDKLKSSSNNSYTPPIFSMDGVSVDVNKTSNGLNGLNSQDNKWESEHLDTQKLISGPHETRYKAVELNVSLATDSVSSPQMNGHMAENETIRIMPTVEHIENVHSNDSCAEVIAQSTEFLSESLPSDTRSFSKSTDLDDKKKLEESLHEEPYAAHKLVLQTRDSSQRNGDIKDYNFNEFTNVFSEGNIRDLDESVMSENQNSTHAWTFFSMSSEAENADKNVQHSENLPQIVIDPCAEPNLEQEFENFARTADGCNKSKQSDDMDPNTFETDIDVDDIDLDEDEQFVDGGEFSLYFKRPVSVTDLDKIIESTGTGRDDAESKRARISSEEDVERIVAEITQTKISPTQPAHIRNNSVQETSNDKFIASNEKQDKEIYRTGSSTTKKAVNDKEIAQDRGMRQGLISGNITKSAVDRQNVNTQDSLDEIDVGSRSDEVSIAIVTLESETVCVQEGVQQGVRQDVQEGVRQDVQQDNVSVKAISDIQVSSFDLPGVTPMDQLDTAPKDLPLEEIIEANAVTEVHEIPGSELANSAPLHILPVDKTIEVTTVAVNENIPDTKQDGQKTTVPESVVILEHTHPDYELTNKRTECSAEKAVCENSEEHQVCDIKTSQVDYTTKEEQEQTKFSVLQKAAENFQEAEATCTTHEECELSDISLDEIDFISDSESLSFTLETPEIIENDEASEIEEEFAEYTILNPTRTRSKYLISGVTRLPERRSKSLSSQQVEPVKDTSSHKSINFASKVQLETTSPGSQNMGLRIILTGRASNLANQSTDSEHLQTGKNGLRESSADALNKNKDEYMLPQSVQNRDAIALTKQSNLSKSTNELHEPKLQEVCFGVEETVFQASKSDNEAAPGERADNPLSPMYNDAIELEGTPKTYTAKITMQENLPDRRRIIVLNVRKKSPGNARWKSMSDLDHMRSAISDITKELENVSLEDQEEPEPLVQRLRSGTPVEIMVPYKDEEQSRGKQAPSLESGYCSPELREDKRTGTFSPPIIDIYEKRSPELQENVSQGGGSQHSPPTCKRTQETIFAVSAEPFSEVMIPKHSEDMTSTVGHGQQQAVSDVIQETVLPVDVEPSHTRPEHVHNVSRPPVHTGNTSQKDILPPPVAVKVQERIKKETTFPAYSNSAPETSKPEVNKTLRGHSLQESDTRSKQTVSPLLSQTTKLENKQKTETIFAVSAEPRPLSFSPPPPATHLEPQQSINRERRSPVVVERKVHEIKGQKETVFVVSAEPQFSVIKTNKINKESEDLGGEREDKLATKQDDAVFGVFARPETVKGAPVSREKSISPTEQIAVQAVAVCERNPTPVLVKEIKKMEKTTLVDARLDPASETIVNIFSDEEDNARSPYRHGLQTKPSEPVVEPIDASQVPVIHAFPVNDGYADEELDDVFVEHVLPPGYRADQLPVDGVTSPINLASVRHIRASSGDREVVSYDADSETSSVQDQLTPQRVRHRHTKASLEAASINVRLSESDTDESSSTPTNSTPTALPQGSSVASDFEPYSLGFIASTPSDSRTQRDEDVITAAVMVGVRNDKPQYYEAVGSEEQVTDESTEEQLHQLKPRNKSDDELPSFVGSAFRPVNGARSHAVRRPRPRSDVFVSRERAVSDEEAVLRSGQLYGKSVEEQPFSTGWEEPPSLRDVDSGKSMPNLHKQEQTISPNVSKLNSHTRMWLSQNTGIDFDGDDVMTSELFLLPSSKIDLSMQDDMSDTLSTRPQTPMSEFSYAGETPFASLRRNSRTVVTCANTYCGKEEVLFGLEKTSFTSCPACFTYYCSRDCRRINWREHKKICFFGRINSYIRSFVYYCNRKEELRLHLSKIAKSGFKKKGRGCIMVMFASPQLARTFMTTGCKVFPSPPSYSALAELKAEGVISKHRVSMLQSLEDYDPYQEFVLNLAIIAGKMENLPNAPMPRHKLNTVLHCVRISLSNTVVPSSPATSSDTSTETKVFRLPKCARHEFVDDVEARRHYCRNISKSLKQYGVRLKHDYPDVYEKMCLYVEKSVDFEPLTVYGNKGNKIVLCKIMPETGHTHSFSK